MDWKLWVSLSAAPIAFAVALFIWQEAAKPIPKPITPEQQAAADIRILRQTAAAPGMPVYNQIVRDENMRKSASAVDYSAGDGDQAIDEVFREKDEEDNQRLMNSLFSVGGINPYQAADAQKLGLNLAGGSDAAAGNMQELRRRALVKAKEDYYLAAYDPILARQLTDPEFAAMASPDYQPPTPIGTAQRILKNAGGAVAATFLAIFSLTLLAVFLIGNAWKNRRRAYDASVYVAGRAYKMKKKASDRLSSFADQAKAAAEK